jgi:hypothetical protein
VDTESNPGQRIAFICVGIVVAAVVGVVVAMSLRAGLGTASADGSGESAGAAASRTVPALVSVDSSAINAVGYAADTREMIVETRDGRQYAYRDVPAEIHQAFLDSPSKGTFYNEQVRGKFESSTPEPEID